MLVLFVLGFVLSLVAVATPWWSYADSSHNESETVNFLVGSTYSVTCSGSGCGAFAAGSFSYSIFGGSIGSMYGALEALAAFAAVAAALAAIFGCWGVFRRTDRGLRPVLTVLLVLVASGLLFASTLWIASAQPGAFGSSVSFAGTTPGGLTPLNAFWGSSSSGGSSATWGAGVGWYCAFFAGLILLVDLFALLLLNRSRIPRAVVVRGELPRVAMNPNVYIPTPGVAPLPAQHGYTAPPPAETAVPNASPVAVPSTPPPAATVACPACGYQNSARSKTCSYCQRPLR